MTDIEIERLKAVLKKHKVVWDTYEVTGLGMVDEEPVAYCRSNHHHYIDLYNADINDFSIVLTIDQAYQLHIVT